MDEIIKDLTGERDSNLCTSGDCNVCFFWADIVERTVKVKAKLDALTELVDDLATTCCECNVDNRCFACRALELTSKG